MSDEPEIRTQKYADHTQVTVVGELDIFTSPRLRQALLAVEADGETYIWLDLAEAAYADSMSLGVIVACIKRLQACGGELRVVDVSRNVRKVLGLVGLSAWVRPLDRSATA